MSWAERLDELRQWRQDVEQVRLRLDQLCGEADGLVALVEAVWRDDTPKLDPFGPHRRIFMDVDAKCDCLKARRLEWNVEGSVQAKLDWLSKSTTSWRCARDAGSSSSHWTVPPTPATSRSSYHLFE